MMALIHNAAESPARRKRAPQQADLASPPQRKRLLSKQDSAEKDKRQRRVIEDTSAPVKLSTLSGAPGPADCAFDEHPKLQNLQVAAIAKEEDSLDECKVLMVLFEGLDFVLRLLNARGVKPLLAVVRRDVESVAGRDLNDVRLAGILGLVPSMIDVRWVGAGPGAKLEVFQRTKGGELRAPTMEELRERKEAFKVVLAAATENRQIPRFSFPPQPLALKQDVKPLNEAPPSLPAPKASKPVDSKGLNAIQRREALLARVRVKAAATESVEAKEYEEFRQRIVVCDNAMAAHSVLQSLFARGEGKFSAATEVEVLQALSSNAFGMQSRRTLSKEAATEAVKLLAQKSDGWFSVTAGVHIPDAKYFRRLPKGSAAAAIASVQAERQDLEKQLRRLCELAKQRDEEPNSQPMLALEAERPVAIAAPAACAVPASVEVVDIDDVVEISAPVLQGVVEVEDVEEVEDVVEVARPLGNGRPVQQKTTAAKKAVPKKPAAKKPAAKKTAAKKTR